MFLPYCSVLAAITSIRDTIASAFASKVVEEEEAEMQEDLAGKNQEASVNHHLNLVFLVSHLLAQEKVNNLISWVDRTAELLVLI